MKFRKIKNYLLSDNISQNKNYKAYIYKDKTGIYLAINTDCLLKDYYLCDGDDDGEYYYKASSVEEKLWLDELIPLKLKKIKFKKGKK